MKRFLFLLCSIVLIVSFLVIPAFAAVEPFESSKIQSTDRFFDSNPDRGTDYIIDTEPYFQLWTGKWFDYLGAFKVTSSVLYAESLSGRIRPFGNTGLNIGSSVGDVLTNGKYFSIASIPRYTYLFEFSFTVTDASGGRQVLPQQNTLQGYFYLFFVDTEGKIVYKTSKPIKYRESIANDFSSATYSVDTDFSFRIGDELKNLPVEAVGFVPLYTFYTLDTSLYSSQVVVTTDFTFLNRFTSSQLIENNQNTIINNQNQIQDKINSIFDSKPNVQSPSGSDSVGELGQLENSLMADISKGLDDALLYISTAYDFMMEMLPAFSVMITIVDSFSVIPFVTGLLLISLSLSVAASLLNLGLEATRSGARQADREARGRYYASKSSYFESKSRYFDAKRQYFESRRR